jgi:hypothetical protein
MTPQEQQVIDSLFQRLAQGAVQAGPRDPQVEALIQQHFSQLPGAAYYMAQTMLVQERALQQAEARLAQQQPGGGSFLPPAGGYAQGAPAPGYYPGGQPAYQQPLQQQPQQSFGGGGFLAGAGKIALGVGGGLLVAEAASGIARDLFGGGGFGGGGFDRDDRDGFDQDDRGDYQQDQQQDDGGFGQGDNDQSGGFDDGGGGFDGGGDS